MIRNMSWRQPVTEAGCDVIPFPVDDRARARLGLEQVRIHLTALGREMQWLAKGNFRSPGEWAKETATSIVRTECIADCLAQATAVSPAVSADERCHQSCIGAARDELRSSLCETASSLARLSDPAAGAADRREVLRELPLHRMRQQRILGRLHELIE
jgi:hypothetical protein